MCNDLSPWLVLVEHNNIIHRVIEMGSDGNFSTVEIKYFMKISLKMTFFRHCDSYIYNTL